MRVLYVTNGFPYPLTSGYLRHHHLLRALAPRHEVTLLSMVSSRHTAQDREAVESMGVEVRTYERDEGSRSPARARWRRRVARLVPTLAAGGVRRMATEAAELVRDGRVDVVVFSGKETHPVLRALPSHVPVLADVCDATSDRLRTQLRDAPLGDRPALAAQLVSVRRVERHIERRAAHALFASERDRAALDWSGPATVVPNGVDAAVWHRSTPTLGQRTIVFTGKLDYPPNEDAALVLVEHVLPLVRERFPDVRLLLVGRDPTPRLRDAGARAGAEVTGEVPDVRPYLEQASVFAAPLRFAAGIQNKLLEALAMEVPCVASGAAVAGLIVDATEPPVVRADTPAAMADALCDVIRRVEADPWPDAAARRWVTSRFDWTRAGCLVEGRLADVRAEHPRGALR